MGKDKLIHQKKMKYVAAYCLFVLSGKENPSAKDVTKCLKDSGCEVDESAVKSVCDALTGKQLHEVINAGFGKIASLNLGGGGGSSSGPAQQSSGPAKVEEKKEEAPPEEEEEDMDLG